MQYVSVLVFSASTLLDPAITGIISYSAGLEGLPDARTIWGGLLIVLGVGAVTLGESHHEEVQTPIEDLSQVTDGDVEMMISSQNPIEND